MESICIPSTSELPEIPKTIDEINEPFRQIVIDAWRCTEAILRCIMAWHAWIQAFEDDMRELGCSSDARAGECSRLYTETALRLLALHKLRVSFPPFAGKTADETMLLFPPRPRLFKWLEGYDVDEAKLRLINIHCLEGWLLTLKWQLENAPRVAFANGPETSVGNDQLVTVLTDDARMNHLDLANAVGLDAEKLRKRLERWRAKNSTGWEEVVMPAAGQPKYLYHVAAVRHLLK